MTKIEKSLEGPTLRSCQRTPKLNVKIHSTRFKFMLFSNFTQAENGLERFSPWRNKKKEKFKNPKNGQLWKVTTRHKPNIKNLILVCFLKILHAKNGKDPLENKKCLGAMFWPNWVNEKMVKFRQLSRPVIVRYSQKIARIDYNYRL
jgi:hypothetical protein